MSDATMRPFQPEDLPELCEIAVRAWEPVFADWQELMGDEMFLAGWPDWRADKAGQIVDFCERTPEWCLVSEVEGRVVGFITYTPSRETAIAEIGNNAVDPEYQGRGIGTEQYRRVLEVFRQEGMKFAKVSTGLDRAHAPARRAYEKAGFAQFIPMVYYYREL